jgi:hypothetical protein
MNSLDVVNRCPSSNTGRRPKRPVGNPSNGLTKPPAAVTSIRTSQVLREILTKNPAQKDFTVQQIVDSIGQTRAGASLVFFSIPGMLPVPGTSNLVGLPAGLIAGQMIAGKSEIKLPEFVLKRSVPRRSLTVAIYAILPVLEKAEKATKPRRRWASDPTVQRLLGVLILILAIAIAFPVLGFKAPNAASIFIIALGLVERDGLAIMIGVVAGLTSLALMAGAGVTALRSMTGGWVKRMLKKIGLKWATKKGFQWAVRFLKKRGAQWTTLLLLEWAEMILLWEPESSSGKLKAKQRKKIALKGRRKGTTIRRSQKVRRPAAPRVPLQAAAPSSMSKRSVGSTPG